MRLEGGVKTIILDGARLPTEPAPIRRDGRDPAAVHVFSRHRSALAFSQSIASMEVEEEEDEDNEGEEDEEEGHVEIEDDDDADESPAEVQSLAKRLRTVEPTAGRKSTLPVHALVHAFHCHDDQCTQRTCPETKEGVLKRMVRGATPCQRSIPDFRSRSLCVSH